MAANVLAVHALSIFRTVCNFQSKFLILFFQIITRQSVSVFQVLFCISQASWLFQVHCVLCSCDLPLLALVVLLSSRVYTKPIPFVWLQHRPFTSLSSSSFSFSHLGGSQLMRSLGPFSCIQCCKILHFTNTLKKVLWEHWVLFPLLSYIAFCGIVALGKFA